MFKGLGWFGFGVFIALSAILLQFGPGLGFLFGAAVAVSIGCASLLLMNLPNGILGTFQGLRGPQKLDARELIQRIEEVALIIRQDGLLALEARRKELKDPNLSYLLKRIMDGFEAKDLIPWIQNQKKLKLEQLQVMDDVSQRFTGLVPSLGLFSSLILISGVLSGSDRGPDLIGVAQVFTPFLLTLGVQVLLDSAFGKMQAELRIEFEHYFSTLESGISGIQSGLNPELLSERMRVRIQAGRVWGTK